MRFPTMWYVRPAKAQISLRICHIVGNHMSQLKYTDQTADVLFACNRVRFSQVKAHM